MLGLHPKEKFKKKIREAIETKAIDGNENLEVEVSLNIGKINLEHKISGIIKLN